jgi:hypothetical protein
VFDLGYADQMLTLFPVFERRALIYSTLYADDGSAFRDRIWDSEDLPKLSQRIGEHNGKFKSGSSQITQTGLLPKDLADGQVDLIQEKGMFRGFADSIGRKASQFGNYVKDSKVGKAYDSLKSRLSTKNESKHHNIDSAADTYEEENMIRKRKKLRHFK